MLLLLLSLLTEVLFKFENNSSVVSLFIFILFSSSFFNILFIIVRELSKLIPSFILFSQISAMDFDSSLFLKFPFWAINPRKLFCICGFSFLIPSLTIFLILLSLLISTLLFIFKLSVINFEPFIAVFSF